MKIRRLCVLFLASTLTAQVTTVAETVDRKLTRVAWFDRAGAAHQVWIDYGTPTWRDTYQAQSGKPGMFILGKGAWTTLYSTIRAEIGGTEITPGWWHLCVERDDQGRWALLGYDAAAVTAARADNLFSRQLRPKLRIPLAHEDDAPTVADLAIELTAEATPGHALLTLRWGPHRMSAQLVAQLELPEPAPVPPFALPAPDQTTTTASGLRYQVLAAGAGNAPTADDTLLVRYALWKEDGLPIDSSYERGSDPTPLELEHVIAGMRETLLLMRPGAVFRVVIPPQLAYGDNAPPQIGKNATLVFHVELQSIEGK